MGELIITDHALERFRERVSGKGDTVKRIKLLFSQSRKLNLLPLNQYNMRFFTKYSDNAFFVYNNTVTVTKQDKNGKGTVVVTFLKWNADLKKCLY